MTGAVLVLIGAYGAWALPPIEFTSMDSCLSARERIVAEQAYRDMLEEVRDQKTPMTLGQLDAQQPIIEKRKIAERITAECLPR